MSTETKEGPGNLPEVVVLIFHRSDGRILLEQRIEEDAFKNQWTFPGGKVDPEDHLQQKDYWEAAAIRESVEEVSLVPVTTRHSGSFVGTSKNGNVWRFHIVAVDKWTGDLKNNEPEKRRLQWLTLEEAKQRMEGTPVDESIHNCTKSFLTGTLTSQ